MNAKIPLRPILNQINIAFDPEVEACRARWSSCDSSWALRRAAEEGGALASSSGTCSRPEPLRLLVLRRVLTLLLLLLALRI